MNDAARLSMPRGRPMWRRAATRLAAVGLAGLLGLSGVQCVQDLITGSRVPHYAFDVSSHSVDLAVDDTVPPPSSTLWIDGDSVISPIRLSFLSGDSGVVRIDSAGRLIVLKRGAVTLKVRPVSAALAVDTLWDSLVVRGIAYQLTTLASPSVDTVESFQGTLALSVTAKGRYGRTIDARPEWRIVNSTGAVALLDPASGLVRAISNG